MEKKPFLSSSNMISPSSSFKPKLNDQDYMELVCENGQILAKSRRPGSFQNRRTQSLLDLYETEYDESFKKHVENLEDTQVVPVSNDNEQRKKTKKIKSSNIESKSNKRIESSTLLDGSLKGSKNVNATPPPDEQSVAVGRSTDLYFASSSMFSRGTSSDLSCCSLKRKYGDIEEDESTYLSNNSDDESDYAKKRRTRKRVTRRKRSTEVHNLSERKRRNEISKRMRALQELLPNCYKDDKISLLDEAIKYMKTLQLQVQMMNMRNGLIRPPTMLPMGHYSPMSLEMQMGAAVATTTSVPQFMPMTVRGTGFPGIIDASSQMLRFFNQPMGLLPNSQIFSPLESCYPQFVTPSYVPQTHFRKSASTSDLENTMQLRGINGYYS